MVPREVECVEGIGVEEWLVETVMALYEGAETAVIIADGKTD